MNRDKVLKELMERRVRREAAVRETDSPGQHDALATAWREAHDDAAEAYVAWSEDAGADPDAYIVYRAAQDRADEAQDALWQQHILMDVAPGYERWIVS
jgi:hypothetical protein